MSLPKSDFRSSPDIRPSPIAGRWYPSDPQRLVSSIEEFIQAAELPEFEGEVIGIMVPHAGHQYSGPVAGYAFAALRGLSPEVVAVVSPMHYPYHQPIITSRHHAYETPLGLIPVDRPALESLDLRLEERLGYGLSPVSEDPEHSLEIELPFLQRALSAPFELLPLMLRAQTASVARTLGEELAEVLRNRRSLLVASTDLSHFYTQVAAHKLDSEILRQVANFNPEGVLEAEEEGRGFACGKGALAAVMWAAKALGANRSLVVRYATSGDVTGDFHQVVGYGAALFIHQGKS